MISRAQQPQPWCRLGRIGQQHHAKICWKKQVRRGSLFSVWKIKVLWAETAPVWAQSHEPAKPLMHRQMVEKKEEEKHLLGNRRWSVTFHRSGPSFVLVANDRNRRTRTASLPTAGSFHHISIFPGHFKNQRFENPFIALKILREQMCTNVFTRGVRRETFTLQSGICSLIHLMRKTVFRSADELKPRIRDHFLINVPPFVRFKCLCPSPVCSYWIVHHCWAQRCKLRPHIIWSFIKIENPNLALRAK